jgi:hypothetical protein
MIHAHDPPPTRRSWLGTAGLVAVAMAATVGLTRLAYRVLTSQSEGNGGITVQTELISLWMHPELFELAQQPPEAAACRSQAAF